jgi:RNA polymerase sigma factor (sigma-70 family)
MPTSPLSVVIQHLLGDVRPDGDGMTDGELLARFLGGRDEDALVSLVRRHARMVWGVCRRLLNHHDAEDAFQATFLVLVRKAADVPGRAVANWLYGVARQTAVRLRATAAKRGQRETQVANMPEPTAPEARDADLQALVDEELSRLPDRYRGVVVLCDLEGMTRGEAARELGIPEGSVASRLARARVMLAKRLMKRGVVFSSGSVAVVLSSGSASGAASPALVASTIKAASLLAAGQAGVVSAKVAALAEGVMKAMLLTKLKIATAVLLVAAALAGSAGFLYRTQAAEPGEKAPTPLAQAKQNPQADTKSKLDLLKELVEDAERDVQDAEARLNNSKERLRRLKQVHEAAREEQEGLTAWGKEYGGLQGGLGFRPGEKRVYRHGEVVTLVVRARNVGKKEVKFKYAPLYFMYSPPAVTDAEGKPVALGNGFSPYYSNDVLEEMTLAPGKSIDLHTLELSLRPVGDRTNPTTLADALRGKLYGPGKFIIQYKNLDGYWTGIYAAASNDGSLINLATGRLELEVKSSDSPPPKAQP